MKEHPTQLSSQCSCPKLENFCFKNLNCQIRNKQFKCVYHCCMQNYSSQQALSQRENVAEIRPLITNSVGSEIIVFGLVDSSLSSKQDLVWFQFLHFIHSLVYKLWVLLLMFFNPPGPEQIIILTALSCWTQHSQCWVSKSGDSLWHHTYFPSVKGGELLYISG